MKLKMVKSKRMMRMIRAGSARIMASLKIRSRLDLKKVNLREMRGAFEAKTPLDV